MKLWIDGQALQSPSRFRGIGRYVIELLRAIASSENAPDMHISFNLAMEDTLDTARNMVRAFIPEQNIHVWHAIAETGEAVDGYTPERRFSEATLAYHVATLSPNIALSASPLEGGNDKCVPLLAKHGQSIRTAGIFYDAIPLRYPDIYLGDGPPLDYFVRRLEAYREFDAVLSISDFSDGEIRSLVGIETSTPIYAGLSRNFLDTMQEMKTASSRGDVRDISDLGPYVLYVGGLDWRKNVELLFKAFPLLPNRHKNVNFVIAGQHQPNELKRFMALWAEAGLAMDRLHMLGQVTDEHLISLYKNAQCLVQPSLLEGFGLTVLEAAACDTPVIVANAGSLPEVVGTRDGLFDPSNEQELADRLIEVLEQPQLARKLVERARARISTYSWKNSAELAMNAMRAVAMQDRQASQTDAKSILVKAYKETGILPRIAAGAAAFASPTQSQTPEVIWDVSATSQAFSGFDTGIQRVVRKIAHRVDNLEGHSLYAAMAPASYIEVEAKSGTLTPRPHRMFQVGQHHTVVVLDSSWDLTDAHREQLKRARLLGGKVYAVLYDLVPIRLPGMCLTGLPDIFSDWLEMLASNADGIVCISKAVADELALFLKGIDFNRTIEIHYWHLGGDFKNKSQPMSQQSPANRLKGSDGTKKFLMVGTIEPRKGHSVALDGFEAALADGLDAELTVIGRRGWNSTNIARRLEVKTRLSRSIRWLDDASDEDLATAYSEADAIICASHAEGFGLPLIEASQSGLPVIASDIPVFREVGEMAATTYFSSGDSEDLARVLMEFDPYQHVTRPLKSAVSWDQSTQWLVDIVTGQRDPHHIHSPTIIDLDRSLARTALTMEEHLEIDEDEYSLELIGKPAPTDMGVHLAYMRLRKHSSGVWTSLGPDGSVIGGVALGVRYEENDDVLDTPNHARAFIPYAIVPGLDYIFALPLHSELWRNGKTFHIELVREGREWIGNAVTVSMNDFR